MRYLIFSAVIVFLSLVSSTARADEPFSSSAHGEALYLVMSTQTETLRRLDADAESQETAPRNWAVFRPAGSGVLDMTHTFTVTFSIAGKHVASWYVNTGEGTVELLPVAAEPEPAK